MPSEKKDWPAPVKTAEHHLLLSLGKPAVERVPTRAGKTTLVRQVRTKGDPPAAQASWQGKGTVVMSKVRSTTILAVRHQGKVALGGDGQVTLGNVVMKSDARKVRRLHEGKVLVGFAGASADAFALLERFEARLKDYQGSVPRAATELAKEWRMDRALRRLEAMMIAVDRTSLLLISGTGDVIQPTDGVAAIGSGGAYALAAARALMIHSNLEAGPIVRASLEIAGDLCIFSNRNIEIEEIPCG